MVRRLLGSLIVGVTAVALSCAANPNAPSPVKKDDPAAIGLRAPDALLVQHAVTQCQADARGAGLHDHAA